MVLESMLHSMEPLMIYRADAEHLIHELSTYADEIDRIYVELNTILPEAFLATAVDRGLREYEELFGPAREALTPAQRRTLLRQRMSLGEGDFTLAGIQKALDSFGLEYTISEFPRMNRLNIIAQTDYTKAEQAFIDREVSKIIPTHLDYQMVFNTLTWEQLDARNKTFEELDLDNLTWEQINALE